MKRLTRPLGMELAPTLAAGLLGLASVFANLARAAPPTVPVSSTGSSSTDKAATPGTAASASAEEVPQTQDAGRAGPAEPNVRRTLIDAPGKHIEELRVRGQVQSIEVKIRPTLGLPSHYQVLPEPGYQDPSLVWGHGVAGQRVWTAFTF